MAEENIVILPEPRQAGGMSLEQVLALRRSVRKFSSRALTDEQLGQLLWAGQGISDPDLKLRTAPSAGALYPLELFLVTSTGVFHYLPEKHSLTLIKEMDHREELAAAALNQEFIAAAPAVIIVSAVYQRMFRRYGDLWGELYVHLEAGHVGENILLQAVALGLGAAPIGAFNRPEVKDALGLPKDTVPLCLFPVGYEEKSKPALDE